MVEPIKYPNEGIVFLVDFVRVMQYPSKCQNEYDSTQCIYGLPSEGYYKKIKSFWV
jgi:hypothetical protein